MTGADSVSADPVSKNENNYDFESGLAAATLLSDLEKRNLLRLSEKIFRIKNGNL